MFEKLDAEVAKSLVSDYDPVCSYELETDATGMYVLATNTETGEKSATRLQEGTHQSVHINPIWSEVSLEAERRSLRASRIKQDAVTIFICASVLLLVALAFYFHN